MIPFYNEQDNVEVLLSEIDTVLADLFVYEIIAVDDGSSDETAHVLQRLAARVAHLRIVQLPANCGQSTALANGIHAARAPLIVTLDGDGQNPPANIPQLLQAYHARPSRPCIVVGWRQKRRDNGFRRLSSRLANGLRRRVLDDRCADTGCGLKVFERDMFLSLPRFDHMHRFFPALFRRAGGEIVNVPVAHRPRLSGQSKYGVHNRLWTGLVDLAGVYWLLRRNCPIRRELHDA